MKDMNKSFEQLRNRVPSAKRPGKRTSKIHLLHLAIKYIKHLKFLLSFPAGQVIPPQIVQFDPSVEAWNKLKHYNNEYSAADKKHWECIKHGLYFQKNV